MPPSRTGPTWRRPARLGGTARGSEPSSSHLPRRDLDRHQHDAPLWPQSERRAPRRRRPLRSLEDDDFRRRPALRWAHCSLRHGGPINGEWLRTYVEKVLAPDAAARRHRNPGQSQLAQGRRRARDRRGARRQAALPRYSPDLNPIEQLFAKLKALLRKAAARTVEALWTAVATLLTAFSTDECANYFANAGYRRSS